MRFTKTSLPGPWLIEPECYTDTQGFFARSCCDREFDNHGLWHKWMQFNIPYNKSKGTLRGLHFSLPTIHQGLEQTVACYRSQCDQGSLST